MLLPDTLRKRRNRGTTQTLQHLQGQPMNTAESPSQATLALSAAVQPRQQTCGSTTESTAMLVPCFLNRRKIHKGLAMSSKNFDARSILHSKCPNSFGHAGNEQDLQKLHHCKAVSEVAVLCICAFAMMQRCHSCIWRCQLTFFRPCARPARFSTLVPLTEQLLAPVQCRQASDMTKQSNPSAGRPKNYSVQASPPATQSVPVVPQVCSGCGIGLQAQKPSAPG